MGADCPCFASAVVSGHRRFEWSRCMFHQSLIFETIINPRSADIAGLMVHT
jgi:hypothetical protein